MPQTFQVLRCYKCLVFQIHLTKKSNKFQCKMCGEKQSIKRHYGLGTSKDCRLHVQKLNGLRGEIDELKETKNDPDSEVNDDDESENEKLVNTKNNNKNIKSKWSEYIENETQTTSEDTMFLDNTEVVLEVPKKRAKILGKSKKIKHTFVTPIANVTQSTYSIPDESKIILKANTSDLVNESEELENFDLGNDHEISSTSGSNIKNNVKLQNKFEAPKVLDMNKPITKLTCTNINQNSKWAKYDDSNSEDDCEGSDQFERSKFENEEDTQYEGNDQYYEDYENISEEQLNEENRENNISKIKEVQPTNSDVTKNKHHSLFSLCDVDDSDIDNILDF